MSEWLVSFLQEKIASEKIKKSTSIKLGGFTVLAATLIFVLQPSDLHKTYFDEGSDAGELIASIELSNEQKTAWHLPQVPWPTWVSNKWNVTTTSLSNAQDLGTVPSDDIVLFRTDRIPDWLQKEVVFAADQQKGRYATIKAHAMKGFIIGASK